MRALTTLLLASALVVAPDPRAFVAVGFALWLTLAAIMAFDGLRARFEAQQEAGDQGADRDVITVHNRGVR